MNVKPSDDHQFSHHLEVLMLSLTHDGRFREAHALKDECNGYGFHHWEPWFRLYMAERDWPAALKLAEDRRKSDKTLASYMTALVYLAQGDACQATPHVEVLEEAFRTRKSDRNLRMRLWETRGMLLCETGGGEAGLKLLTKLVDETKNDYHFHAWGNGAYYMEVWGLAALRCGNLAVAEEAFLEALAHDSGSVRGALGLQVLCDQQGRYDEAKRYTELAHRFWKRAEPANFETEFAAIRQTCAGKNVPTTDSPTEGKHP
jgi:tetratricopeptide (TPR) repeat protein